jgi:hypothetical protein
MGDDPIARLRAEMDQSREGLREYAGGLWAFYSQCVSEGFSVDQAFGLTVTMISTIAQMPPAGGDGS